MKLPVLIMCPDNAGSLAATRLFGRAGVPVTVASSGPLAASRWSCFADKLWHFKLGRREDQIVHRMKQFANSNGKHVLLASSDELTWLFARYYDLLSEKFLVYSPAISVIDRVLNKGKLRDACETAGIPTLKTWCPQNYAELLAVRHYFEYPVLIKPRSHIFDTRHEKGKVVGSEADLLSDFAAYQASERTGKHKPAPQPYPIFQEFVQKAVENVVSISGFIDRSGSRTVLRGSRKVFQRSRPVGLGLAFEAIEVDPWLGKKSIALCRQLGYFGIFEIEFVELNGRWHLIDFNPRFYREMGLDIASGAPLPLLAYVDACGDLAALDEAVEAANRITIVPLGYSDIFTTRIVVAFRLASSLFLEWDAFRWHWRMRGCLIDAFWDWSDPLPWVAHALSELLRGARLTVRAAVWTFRRSVRSIRPTEQELNA